MKAFLLFLSSLLAFPGFSLYLPATMGEEPSLSTDSLYRKSFLIETKKGGVSGIFIASEASDQISGSFINEFGISAIDFIYSRKTDKVKLLNVVSFLNKWYIRKVLKKDLKHCLQELFGIQCRQDNNFEVRRSGDTLSVTDRRYHLKYTFFPLTEKESNDTEE